MAEHKPTPEEKNDFFESMPATANQYFPRTEEVEAEEERQPGEPSLDEIRLTAIVTILLTVLVAIGLGLLLLRAIDTLNSVGPTTYTQTDLDTR